MVKQIKISNFTEVKNIMNAATHCVDEIGVHDGKGSIADAKSILGLMSLDYTHPVMLVSENEKELQRVYEARLVADHSPHLLLHFIILKSLTILNILSIMNAEYTKRSGRG